MLIKPARKVLTALEESRRKHSLNSRVNLFINWQQKNLNENGFVVLAHIIEQTNNLTSWHFGTWIPPGLSLWRLSHSDRDLQSVWLSGELHLVRVAALRGCMVGPALEDEHQGFFTCVHLKSINRNAVIEAAERQHFWQQQCTAWTSYITTIFYNLLMRYLESGPSANWVLNHEEELGD